MTGGRPERVRRMQTVLEQRIAWVRCALEAVYHRHNVSAILRTCDAMGLHHVDLVEGHFKAAKGTARGADRWLDLQHHRDPVSAIEHIQGQGYDIWIADFAPHGLSPEDVPLERPICLWMGAELAGVGPQAKQAATGVITLPMRGFAQSLNVSVASALCIRTLAERARMIHGEAAKIDEDERERTWARWRAQEEAMGRGVDARMTLSMPDPTDDA